MRVRKVVDLSLALDSHTQIYPGDPPVELRVHSTIEADGFNLLSVAMGSQSGTNCDAPYHFLESGARIDEVEIGLFAGPGVVIDLRSKVDREEITVEDVAGSLDRIAPGVIVVLHTGWSQYYATERYFDHPYLGSAACTAMLERGARTFCLDTLNIDETPDAANPGAGFPVHLLIAEAGGVIVENLTALELIDFPDPLITVFPLRFTGADGGPTRATAMHVEF